MEFSQYLVMVVHAGQVSPTFVTSDFNEALKTSRKHMFTRHYIKPTLPLIKGQADKHSEWTRKSSYGPDSMFRSRPKAVQIGQVQLMVKSARVNKLL